MNDNKRPIRIVAASINQAREFSKALVTLGATDIEMEARGHWLDSKGDCVFFDSLAGKVITPLPKSGEYITAIADGERTKVKPDFDDAFPKYSQPYLVVLARLSYSAELY